MTGSFCPQQYLPVLVPLLFVICFPIFWSAVLGLISFMTGWRHLARLFPAGDAIVDGPRWRFRTAGFRFMSHYSGCLTFTATSSGMHLVPLIFFRPFHPPLLIPWAVMEAAVMRVWKFAAPTVVITFRSSDFNAVAQLTPPALTDSLAPAPNRSASTANLYIRLMMPLAREIFSATAASGSSDGARLLSSLDQEPAS